MSKTIRAFVGIDAGTTGCTVMVFDEHGKSLGQGYEEYPCISPYHGWNEQDLKAVWRGISSISFFIGLKSIFVFAIFEVL